jgi:large subunit ribosomal protein L29
MSFPKYQEVDAFNNIVDIDKEIFLLQKNLFDLRLKKSTSQSVKPHLFKHTKRRIAQLKFKKSSLLKQNN